MCEHKRLFPLLLQPTPHPGPQPAALRKQHQQHWSVDLGQQGSRGNNLGWGVGAHMLLCLCYQRTCLTTTFTWTSAGKRSPIMCAANPCMGTAPLTQNAAARTARPGASSVLCALLGAPVRGATCACMEGGRCLKCPQHVRGGLERSRAIRVMALFSIPIVWG